MTALARAVRHPYVRLTRPPTLAATAVPLAVGSAAGSLLRPVAPAALLVMALVAFLLQIATNVANEYFDYRRGLDDPSSVGIAGVIVRGELSAAAVGRAAVAAFGLAFALGLLLVAWRGLALLLLGLLSIAVGVLYSAGPRPLAATPFGELVVFVLMGPIEVSVVSLAVTGAVPPAALVASLPVGVLVAAILLANNLRDRSRDAAHGRRTLAVRLPPREGALLLAALLLLAPALTAAAVAAGALPPSALLVVLAWPWLDPRRLRQAPNPVPAVARAHLAHGLLLAAGLALAHLIR